MATKEEMLNNIQRKINTEKVQKELSNKVSEISALSSGDIRKYEFLTNKDILPSSTEMIIQEKKFDYTPLGKKLDTQAEKLQSIKETGEKQIKAIEENQLVPIKQEEQEEQEKQKRDTPASRLAKSIEKKVEDIELNEKNIDMGDPYYETGKKKFNFLNAEQPTVLFRNIYYGYTTLSDANKKQSDLVAKYRNIGTQGPMPDKKQKFLENINKLLSQRENVLKMYNNKTIPLKDYQSQPGTSNDPRYTSTQQDVSEPESEQEGEGLKIMSPNQMLQRLPILLAQVKAGNNSKELLNEIRQIVYYLYRTKNITKKIYNSIIK